TADDTLRSKLEKDTIDYLKNIPGVYGIESSNVRGKDELRLKLDYDEMAKLGLTAIDVSRTVRAAFEGEVVTSIRKAGEEIDFRVRIKDPKQFRAEGVLDLFISNQDGKLVPLKNFAHFDETEGTAVIHHYDGKRSVTVTAAILGGKIQERRQGFAENERKSFRTNREGLL
ncbi:efflux RND transporter permease subunit, partial [Patescibacteria group bacterium]|nr:efflux RND transporter permease subunit [Patescibacteria group bacterium]